jgi:DNA-binding Xre family transcriptional regulator
MSIHLIQNILKEKQITHEELAKKLEISRPTMYSRFITGKWKASQKKTLKRLGLIN